MLGRRPRTPIEFAAVYYPEHREIAARVHEIMQEHIPVDLSGLQPADELVRDLRIEELDSMAIADLVIGIEDEFNIALNEEEAVAAKSIDDIIRMVIRLKRLERAD